MSIDEREIENILERYTNLLNEHGSDSQQLHLFEKKYADEPEVTRLLKTIKRVRKAFEDGIIE